MFRIIRILPFFFLPVAAMADVFSIDSSIAEVTVYARGATITRDVEYDLPAGQHRLLIDLPRGFDENTLRILADDGLRVGAMGIRDMRLPPDGREIALRQEVEARLDAKALEIRTQQTARTAIGLLVEAANARITMLRAVGNQQATGAITTDGISGTALSDLVELVGAETLAALQDAHLARLDIAEIDRALVVLNEQLMDLRLELEAVSLPLADRTVVSLDVSVDAANSGVIQLKYLVGEAYWEPIYELNLTTETGVLTIDRRVVILQGTGETWEGALIDVSTTQPSYRLSYGELPGHKAYYYKPEPPTPIESDVAGILNYTAPAVMIFEEPARMAGRSFDVSGLNATFQLPHGTIVEGDRQPVIISVDIKSFDTKITARTAPAFSGSDAYVFANFINDAALPYLEGEAAYYRDDGLISADGVLPLMNVGEDVDLAFGNIDGLIVKRLTLNRETGESGVLTTRNDSIDEYEITIENLTGFDWDMILYDRVPYSEQEDLEIAFDAQPQPTAQNIDGERGVLAWEFPLTAGAQKSFLLSYTMEWPEGTEIRR